MNRKLLLIIFVCILSTLSTLSTKVSGTLTLPTTSTMVPDTIIDTVSVVEYGANGFDGIDDTSSIQRALDQADGERELIVYIPAGVYLLTKSLKITSQTKLVLDDLAVIVRNGSFSPMLINKTKGAIGYSANHHISIEGGTWEGNYDEYPTTFCIMLFGHMENLSIQNTKFLHNYNSHSLELNAVRNSSIVSNTFDGYKGPKQKEALQLDLAKNKGVFPPFGEYDQTPCQNIRIQGNTFINQSRGIGSHSYTSNVFHDNVVIEENYFFNVSDKAINMLNYNHVRVRNNVFSEVGTAIEVKSETHRDGLQIEISQNHITRYSKSIKTFNLLRGNPKIRVFNNTIK